MIPAAVRPLGTRNGGIATRFTSTRSPAARTSVLLTAILAGLPVGITACGPGRPGASAELAITPPEWIDFCDVLQHAAPGYSARVWYQPAYARREQMDRYAVEGYQGCIGRTLDRISVFPDGRAYVCSYLFDTSLNFAPDDRRPGRPQPPGQ